MEQWHYRTIFLRERLISDEEQLLSTLGCDSRTRELANSRIPEVPRAMRLGGKRGDRQNPRVCSEVLAIQRIDLGNGVGKSPSVGSKIFVMLSCNVLQ